MITRATRFVAPATFRQRALWWAVAAVFVALGIGGLATFTRNNVLPVDFVMLVVLAAAALSAHLTRSVVRVWIAACLITYGATHVLISLAGPAHLTDVAQAHKWLFFIGLLFLVGQANGVRVPFSMVLRGLLSLLLVKSIVLVFLNPGSRLGILAESNFEITMYCMLMAVLWSTLGRWRFVWLAVLGVCAVLSLSRSGAIAFAILVLFLVLSQSGSRRWTSLAKPIVVAAAVIVPVLVFLDRGNNIEDSDRANFARLFIEATQGRDFGGWLIGAPPITPLPQNICYSLSYYSQLFSSDGSGHCYSVVLHIFVLRALFDFGILGLVLGSGLPFLAMRSAGVSMSLSVSLSAMAFANGLSVSGVNSEFVILPIMLAIMTAPVVERSRSMRLQGALA
jgi:hypothetical protein